MISGNEDGVWLKIGIILGSRLPLALRSGGTVVAPESMVEELSRVSCVPCVSCVACVFCVKVDCGCEAVDMVRRNPLLGVVLRSSSGKAPGMLEISL
jgi:hypothetical protein